MARQQGSPTGCALTLLCRGASVVVDSQGRGERQDEEARRRGDGAVACVSRGELQWGRRRALLRSSSGIYMSYFLVCWILPQRLFTTTLPSVFSHTHGSFVISHPRN